MGAKLLCVPHASAQDLKKLLHEKTLDQMKHLAASGCGELPLWAKFGIPRGRVQGPEPRRGRGRPRKWRTANERWLAWSWKERGWIPKKRGRPKTARWIGVSDRERNKVLNREWQTRRKGQVVATTPVTFIEFCIEDERLRMRGRRRGRRFRNA